MPGLALDITAPQRGYRAAVPGCDENHMDAASLILVRYSLTSAH